MNISALIRGMLVLFFCMFTIGKVYAIDVNINARINHQGNPAEVFLEAGTYTVVPIGTADGGTYDAWSLWSNTSCTNPTGCVRTSPTTVTGWLNVYTVLSPNITSVSIAGQSIAPSNEETIFSNFFLLTTDETKYRVDDGIVYPADIVAQAHGQESVFSVDTA